MKTALLILALLTMPVFAQETAAPVLDDADRKLLIAFDRAAKLADSRCKALEEYQVYDATQKGVATHLQAKYPGFTFDWNARTFKPAGVR